MSKDLRTFSFVHVPFMANGISVIDAYRDALKRELFKTDEQLLEKIQLRNVQVYESGLLPDQFPSDA